MDFIEQNVINNIKMLEDISNPTVSFVKTISLDQGGAIHIFRCLQNNTYYFGMISSESVMYAKAPPELLEEAQLAQ